MDKLHLRLETTIFHITQRYTRILQKQRRPRKKQFKTEDEAVDFKLGRLVRAIKLSQEGEKLLSQDYNQKLKASA